MDKNNPNILDIASSTLAGKPIIGAAGGVGSGVIGIMGVLTPVVEFLTVTMGLMIASLTLYGMIRKALREGQF